MRAKIGFIIVLILIGFGYYFWWPRTHTIELRADGFYPPKLTVAAGSTVVFTNGTDHAFWPASNFHPFHKLYAQFDAKKPISPKEAWQFDFFVPGIWRYHDHLNSRSVGTIIVRSSPWARKGSCKAETCFIQEIESVLEKRGIDEAFAVFGRLYETNPDFSESCHDVTHLLGEAAYRAYMQNGKVVDSIKTSYCGYGFYHGFIEALLFTTGNFEEAKSYCRAVQKTLSKTIVSPNAIYSCYHGLGHGTFDTLGYETWGDDEGMLTAGLTTCEQVTLGEEPELVKQCATGVFNALANAYNNNSYNLAFDTKNPWGLCVKQKNIEYKKACFREVAASYIKLVSTSRSTALNTLQHMSDAVGANATMYSYISEEVRLHVTTPNEYWVDICEGLQRRDLRISCAEGVATGLLWWGAPGREHERVLAFCAHTRLSSENKHACFGYVLPRLYAIFGKAQVSAVCHTVPAEYRRYCL